VYPLSQAVHGLRERVHRALDQLGVAMMQDGPADVIVTPPSQPSTSFDFARRRYVGLHVDQHDHLPLSRRGEARRLCVTNIGWTDRYLNVYPYRLVDLCKALGVTPGSGEPESHQVTDRFFAAHVDAGVLRVRLAPGQGYAFNTQELPHDGTTPAGRYPGVAFHSMGSWPR
jgi:hypothetical protein